jgi:hypothetical protein
MKISSAEGNSVPKNDDTAGLDFLDFLFTVAISVGLTPELIQVSGVTGLLSEAWQKEGRWPCPDELFNIGVFGLGFLNLTLSWFGYHASIRTRPLNYVRGYGMFRFLLDVLLVISYGVILIKFKSFHVVLVLLILVFFIFVVWDCLKIGEYWDEFKLKYESDGILKGFRREWVSVFSFCLFAAVGIAYFLFGLKWVSLILAILITFFYRFNKFFPTWERVLGVKNA